MKETNGETKTNEPIRFTKEEMEHIQKSEYYREELSKSLGNKIILESSAYEIEPYKDKDDRVRLCIRDAIVFDENGSRLSYVLEHIWVSIKNTMKVDFRKPIRVIGFPYEYAHKCNKTIVKNVGMNVIYLDHNTVSGII